ncbi:Fic family protein [Candidatus Peregrinibacteria bacterium]|nr:Fic family protein [Candidatus Peregrinibacteria bacterium]
MNIREKLQIIQKMTGLTQVKLAERFSVSFVAFNNWWTGKSFPRPRAQRAIDELFLEVTGQKIIPADKLTAQKAILKRKSGQHKNVISEISNNPDICDTFTLKLIYNSNRLEGSTLTEPDTAAILFDNVAIPDKSLTEQLEAKNHQTALNYLFDHILKNGELNENLILKLHSILMNGIRPDAGLYRRHAVRILGVNLPTANHLKIPQLMPALMIQLNEKTNDIIALSAKIHAHFEQIHPFSDGNGRIGRLLMVAMLLKANMTPAVIKQERKKLYYTYLHKAQTKNDQSQLENFICEAVMEGFSILERK